MISSLFISLIKFITESLKFYYYIGRLFILHCEPIRNITQITIKRLNYLKIFVFFLIAFPRN